MSTKTTIQVTQATCERLRHLGGKGQTYENIILGLLAERKYAPKLEALTEKCISSIESAKKIGNMSSFIAVDTLLRTLTEFIEHVKSR